MNNALGSPLEALAPNYLNLAFLTAINNIWTLVAIVAGATSFLLTIRKPSKSLIITILPDQKHLDHVGSIHLTVSPVTSANTISADVTCDAMHPDLEPNFNCESMERTKSRKFTAYYEDDVIDAVEDDMDSVDDYGMNVVAFHKNEPSLKRSFKKMSLARTKSCLARFDSFEDLIKLKVFTGEEMGWYRCQDLKVINGNVVRLWDSSWERRMSMTSNFVALTW